MNTTLYIVAITYEREVMKSTTRTTKEKEKETNGSSKCIEYFHKLIYKVFLILIHKNNVKSKHVNTTLSIQKKRIIFRINIRLLPSGGIVIM